MILVTGASGKLGAHVVSKLVQQGRQVAAWSGRTAGKIAGVDLVPVDLADLDQVRRVFAEISPSQVIHCAALSAISDCYRQPQLAERVNHHATALLAELSSRLVYTSTDLVFDGRDAPYGEEDEARPLSVYGKTKYAGELACLSNSNTIVARVSLLYGKTIPVGSSQPTGFFEQQLEKLRNGNGFNLFEDEFRTALALDDAASGLIQLLDCGETGLFHLAGEQRLSRFEMGALLADQLGVAPELVTPVAQKSVSFPEPRPADVSLSCERAKRVVGWDPSSYNEGVQRVIGTH